MMDGDCGGFLLILLMMMMFVWGEEVCCGVVMCFIGLMYVERLC